MNVNDEIREWEIKGHEKVADLQKLSHDYQVVKNYNEEFANFLIKFYDLEQKMVLDYGCGSGFFANMFAEHRCKSYGCDISEAWISFAKEKGSATFFTDDFFNSTLPASNYDFIFCRGLGPLMKIDYTQENRAYLKSMIDALKDNGVAYFILLGNLSGIPDTDRFSGFRNPTIETIRQFFGFAGHVAFINVFNYQAVLVAKSSETAAYYHGKMYSSVKYMLDHLNEWDSIARMKCDKWLQVNGESTLRVEPYALGLLHFISGDQDRYFEQLYLNQTKTGVGKKLLSKLLK